MKSQSLDDWGSGALSKEDQIQVIERKIEEIVEKREKIDAIEIYLVTKLNKLNVEVRSEH